MRIALALGLFLLAASASAQTASAPTPQTPSAAADASVPAPMPRPAVAYKEKGTAMLLSVLVTGGGHFYTGESNKGLALLGISIGAPIAGALGTAATCDYDSRGVCNNGNPVPALLGLSIGMSAWIYGIADAGKSVDRVNTRNGYTLAVAPTVVPSQQGAQPGLALTARF